MNRDKARRFIEEQMPQYRIIDSAEDDAGTMAAADAPDADVNETSLTSWRKLNVRRKGSIANDQATDQADDLRNRFRPRRLQGSSEADSRIKSDQNFSAEEVPSPNDDMRVGKVGLFSVTPKNAPEDATGEPQDLIIDEDEGIIGASS